MTLFVLAKLGAEKIEAERVLLLLVHEPDIPQMDIQILAHWPTISNPHEML